MTDTTMAMDLPVIAAPLRHTDARPSWPIHRAPYSACEHDDAEFPDGATYEVRTGGVLKVLSGNDIHLYSPSYWQEVAIDIGPPDQRDEGPGTGRRRRLQ
ncbi:hypothetical protein [Mycobacterium attenuatum]|uniref:hypothetical protein n=1 Tax=Mycobacterium attenuatum TaxID=2341086 RepID=UPI001FCE69EE|nr:hypothetical protein [Mycobacterium attenuatum]